MFCKYCGNEIENDAYFCKSCGRNLNAPISKKTSSKQNKSFAITSMVLGIVAIVLSLVWKYIAFCCAIISIVFGIISNKQKRKGRKMADTGLILSIIALGICIILCIIEMSASINFLNSGIKH